MKEFRDKVAIITGAGRGIGRGIAERCAQEGMKVVLSGIGMESLSRTEANLKAQGATVMSVQTDVSKVADIERLAQRTMQAFGNVHLLVNNAGVNMVKSVTDLTLTDWQWVLDVNLWGVIHGVHVFLPIMLEQNIECHIVNVSSLAGLISGRNFAAYCVTKHGVVTFSECLHKELLHDAAKVKVSVFCPGYVQSDIADSERNRPANLANDPSEEQFGAATIEARRGNRESLAAGMPALEAADHVFRALRQDQFYILSHPEANEAIQTRMQDILQERNPPL